MKRRLIYTLLFLTLSIGSIMIWIGILWLINLVIPIGIINLGLIVSIAVAVVATFRYIITGKHP